MKNGDWRVDRSYSQTPKARQELLQELRMKIFTQIGNTCAKCGYADERALQVDHVNGGGAKARKEHKGASYYYNILKELRNGSVAYQTLCANCNLIKRRENDEWHRTGIRVGNISSKLL